MAGRQKTLLKAGSVSGAGLHSGKHSTVTFRPGLEDTGLRFFKRGRPVEIESEDVERRSSVGTNNNRIDTVEHALAALTVLEVTNAEIEVDGDELPALDGSALSFVKLIRSLGIGEQNKEASVYQIKEPIFCHEATRAIAIYPADILSVSYVLDYRAPKLTQKVDFAITPEVFEKHIAPARTFCTEKEASSLKAKGLGIGANLENTLVLKEDGGTLNPSRFEDECARHKVLDILGDLGLLGFPVTGRIVGLRSGHSLNRRLVNAIKEQKRRHA